MKGQVIGIGQRRSGTSQKGKKYDGNSVYVIVQAADVQGHKTEEIYFNHLSPVTFPEITINDIINFSYDKSGFLEEVTVVEKAGKASQGVNMKINS